MNSTSWELLGDYLRETKLLGSIQSTLYWDQNTSMPSKGSSWRGEQLSFLAKTIHTRQSCEYFGSLLSEAKAEFKQNCISKNFSKIEISERSRNIALLEQDFNRQKSLDSDLVVHLAIAKSDGYNHWQEAKSKANFKHFAPYLKKLIALRQEEARQLSEPRSCWETLAQPYEPDLTIIRLKELFTPLRKALPDLIDNIRTCNKPTNSSWDLDEKSQEELSFELLNRWSRDIANTSIAKSPHPFSITLGPDDFRITTRVVPEQPFSCFLATAHEWGHSLYEQGLPSVSHEWFAWPLGNATSMGVHESQSLFWENRVARSLAFSEQFWPYFVKSGAPFNSPKDLWRAMNPLEPGLNRVEADELSYGLHILIRTDLEIALLEEGLDVIDLPHEWNEKYKQLLGVIPQDDREGCLQDVHWSEGAFGYFPSYLLGHLISAQLSECMSNELEGPDPISECIRNKNEAQLVSWLRQKVHCHGRQMNGEQLVEFVTGKELSSEAFLNYLKNKLELLSKNS